MTKWNPGIINPDDIIELTGIEILERMRDGRLPHPYICQTLNFVIKDIEPGRVTCAYEPSLDVYNAIACVHGGFLATLLDTAMACAVQSRLPAGKTYTTLEFKVNFIRAVHLETGPITAVGNLIHIGRTTASAEGKLFDQNNKLYAFATTTCALFPLKRKD